jgi:hypothetical protein
MVFDAQDANLLATHPETLSVMIVEGFGFV